MVPGQHGGRSNGPYADADFPLSDHFQGGGGAPGPNIYSLK